MRCLLLGLGLLAGCSLLGDLGPPEPGGRGADPDEAAFLFSLDQVFEFQLDIPPQSWDALLVEPRFYQPATFTYDGVSLEVGVRTKGQLGSFRPMDEGGKTAWKVDFNRYVPGQSFYGLKKLTLNNMVQDPSMMSENLGYEVFKAAGLPYHRSGYAWVEVNGQAWGLYLNLESVSKRFLRRFWEDDSGNLYEGTYNQDDWGFADFVANRIDYWEHDIEGWPENREDLRAVTRSLAEVPEDRLEDLLDDQFVLDELLQFFAIEVFLAHWDGYSGNTNNNRIYLDPSTGRFHFLPWGIDQTFRPWNRVGPEGYDNPGVLFQRVREIPGLWNQYLAAMDATCDLFESLDLAQRAQQISDLTASSIAADPRLELSLQEQQGWVQDVNEFIQTQPDWMRELLP